MYVQSMTDCLDGEGRCVSSNTKMIPAAKNCYKIFCVILSSRLLMRFGGEAWGSDGFWSEVDSHQEKGEKYLPLKTLGRWKKAGRGGVAAGSKHSDLFKTELTGKRDSISHIWLIFS